MSKTSFEAMEGTNRRSPDAALDPDTGYSIFMSSQEHDIHEGNSWEMFLESLNLASGSVVEIQISTGDNEVHLQNIHFWSDAAIARMELLGGVSLTTGTTAIVPVNRNRDPLRIKTKPDDLLIFSDPAGITGGALMESTLFGGGAGVGQSAAAGSGDIGDEFILAKNTDNILRLTHLEPTNARNFLLSVFFYLNVRS
ncbi:MAG: hypothetical protein QGD90_00115 [Candidatus Hydrogenedentes bacterium]|nr:hypothetical protein [Candidatus Hydrogenedentota bacterium]